nr:MAG TPA: hypothetical protein [Caudoviricetes sp.]
MEYQWIDSSYSKTNQNKHLMGWRNPPFCYM